MKKVFLALIVVAIAPLVLVPWIASGENETLYPSIYPDANTSYMPGGVAIGTVDLDGYDLICDQDGDTKLTNDRDAGVADDEIDVTINGAVDFTISANDFTAVSGSAISTDTLDSTSGSGITCGDDLDLGGNALYGLISDVDTTVARSGADEWTITAGGTASAVIDATDISCGVDVDLNSNKLLGLASDADTYLSRTNTDELTCTAGGNASLVVGASEVGLGADLDFGTNDIYNLDEARFDTLAADTAPDVSVIHMSQNTYSKATVNKNGATTAALMGGLETNKYTITNYANCAGDTATVTVGVRGNSFTATSLVEGVAWSAGASNNEAATNLAAAVDALSGVSAVADSAVVWISDDIDTGSLLISISDATCGAATQGNTAITELWGNWLLPSSAAGVLGGQLCFGSGGGYCLKGSGVYGGVGGSSGWIWAFDGSVFAVYDHDLVVGTAGKDVTVQNDAGYEWASYGKLSTIADGKFCLNGTAGTAGSCFDVSNDNIMTLLDNDGSTKAAVVANKLRIEETASSNLKITMSHDANFTSSGFYAADVGFAVGKDATWAWASDNSPAANRSDADTGFARNAAGVIKATNGTTGQGSWLMLNGTFDNATTGSDADSGLITQSGNHFNVSDYQCDATTQLVENSGDPYWEVKVDDTCLAGAGSLTSILKLYDDQVYISNDLVIDNTTTGASADSPVIDLSGNHWNDPNNYECNANAYLDENSGNPYLAFRVDDTCAAGAGTLKEPIRIYDNTMDYLEADGDCGYWSRDHKDASEMEKGTSLSEMAEIGPGSASMVWYLDGTSDYLFFGTKVADDWDAASDVVVTVDVTLASSETANDDIEAELIAEYGAEHEDYDSAKTQTRTVNHDIGAYNDRNTLHTLTFVLDYDLVDNVIQVDDVLKFRFRMDSIASVPDIRVMNADIYYRTCKARYETGGTFPTEG